MSWSALRLVVLSWVVASGCSVVGIRGRGLNERCERTMPAVDAVIASALTLAVVSGDDGDFGDGEVVLGTGVMFGLSAVVGFSAASHCRARRSAPPPMTEKFLGARRWSTTTVVRPSESPVVALERAYQRAAVVCEGFGFSALTSTPLEPRRPTRMTLVYRCH